MFCVFCHARIFAAFGPSTHRSESKISFEELQVLRRVFLVAKWMFLKIGVPPNHQFLIGFSIIFTIHSGVSLFLETPKYLEFLGNFELYGLKTNKKHGDRSSPVR